MKSIHQESQCSRNGRRKAILLVDADPLLQWSVEMYLRRDFIVSKAVGIDYAVESLSNHRFDAVVLCECNDSQISEIESIARKVNPDVRIIRLVVDCRSQKTDDACELIEKPFSLERLAQLLREPE